MAETIGVGIIARNAGKTIRACIKSFAPHVDQIVVVLAGESEDKTATEARKGNKKVEIYPFKWIEDFSAARNFCYSKLHTDWQFWVDADDVVEGAENLRKLCNDANPEVGAIWLTYNYAQDEFGNPTTIYVRERLSRAKYGFVWKSRLHETILPLSQCTLVRDNSVVLKHNHLAGAERHTRNFKILNMMLKESPEDKRVWLYLGHQNFAAGNHSEAAEWYLKFASAKDVVNIERYQALCYGSKALRLIGDVQCIDVSLSAINTYPQYRDGYIEMAQGCLSFGRFDDALKWVQLSETKEVMEPTPDIIFLNPLEFTFNRHIIYSEVYRKREQFEEAIDHFRQAYQVRPSKEIVKEMQALEYQARRQKVIYGFKALSVDLLKNNELTKLEPLMKCIPAWYRDHKDFKMFEATAKRYYEGLEDKPLVEISDGHAMVNIAKSLYPEKLLDDIDRKKDVKRVTVVCPIPTREGQQYRVLSRRDMEELIVSGKKYRHIIELHQEPTRVICDYLKKTPKDLVVRMYLGQGLENWSPKTIKDVGCGGSEIAAYVVAKRFAERGSQPIVYAMDNEVWNGVLFRKYDSFKPETPNCDLFISSRRPDIFSSKIQARQKWLWFHDIHCGPSFTPDVAEDIDAIVCLSKWHANYLKSVYPFLKDAPVWDFDHNSLTYKDGGLPGKFYEDAKVIKQPVMAIIGNGINKERFTELTEKRLPHSFIWMSSPDRGLYEVLELWPKIREALPDATINIFYGWEYFDWTLHIREQRELKDKLKKLIKQDGVKWCGRVGQDELAKELMKTDALLYPPPHTFRETYGISFLEAQAAGVINFYRKNGALGETIGNRGIALPMDTKSDMIIKRIVDTFANYEKCVMLRERGRKYALGRDWSVQGDKMLKLFRRLEDGWNNK